ncbi:vacuolar-H-ATPase H [Penaeus vannamei]|uniref:Vacuolar-H-ATPase H n=1 Tax=Penaeus vannamei TaxID=6689 RepID=A0A3R7Q4F6_PENVA|nr:vacuolar-H-ATPase H [Penaeus vannamei]
MISQEDYDVIVGVEQPGQMRDKLLTSHRYQVARTFMNLLGHISKDQTIQYILTLVDDILSEDKTRVEIFKEYARKHRESMWSPFLNLLTRPDTFIINMTARIIAKLACWSREPMDGSDLTFYLTWLKDQLRTPNKPRLDLFRDKKTRLHLRPLMRVRQPFRCGSQRYPNDTLPPHGRFCEERGLIIGNHRRHSVKKQKHFSLVLSHEHTRNILHFRLDSFPEEEGGRCSQEEHEENPLDHRWQPFSAEDQDLLAGVSVPRSFKEAIVGFPFLVHV